MENPIKAVRGMNDILPSETFLWQYVENILRDSLQSFGYQEIRIPIVEKTELFKRTIGEATDIVEKEMYTFLDRNEESLTLRPEQTAGCVRTGIEHGLFYNQIQRLWYLGPNFRYERPQKGRYRQFHQCGAEVFGLEGPDIDAEVILLSALILEKLGLKEHVQLQLNSLGSIESRANYRKNLIQYFIQHQHLLDEDSQRRLTTNPLRILDSKNPTMQDLIQNAPKMLDYLDSTSKNHFTKLQEYLTAANINYSINPCLVRGLDYYTKTVFEWVTLELGAQGTICAGGRYDGLIEHLGGKPTMALGFAMGLERTILLIEQTQPHLKNKPAPDIYFIVENDDIMKTAHRLVYAIHCQLPSLQIVLHCGGGSLKNQFKKADKSGAHVAFILAEKEIMTKTISIKNLRKDTPQVSITEEDLLNYTKKLFNLSIS